MECIIFSDGLRGRLVKSAREFLFLFFSFFFSPLLLTIGSVKPENLANSGMDLILAHTMYAVVGAIALEKGGYMANKMAQERILEPLGVKTIS